MARALRKTSAPGGPWYEFYRELCPICGHKGGCMIHEDQDRVVCIRVGSKIEWAKNGAMPGYLHFLNAPPKKYDLSLVPDVQNNQKSDDYTLHRVFKELINMTDLDNKHKTHLMSDSRQMTEAQINLRQYRSFPEKPWQVAKKIADRIGGYDNLIGIPGFYTKEGKYGRYFTIAGFNGILIPFRNHLNQIVGFQFRVDSVKNVVTVKEQKNGFYARIIKQPDYVECRYNNKIIFKGKLTKEWFYVKNHDEPIATIKLSKGQRYFWLSSANNDGGTGAGNPLPVHISVPSQDLKEWKSGTKRKAKTIWLGEGPLKNDIAVDRIVELYDQKRLKDIGTTFLALPGVNSWRLAIPYLEDMEVEKVNIAFDADAVNNPYVKHHLIDCAKTLKELGYSANIVIWNEKDGTGLDDLLLNFKIPIIKELF